MEPTTATPKMGRFARGWQLTKSSWRVLRLDKELATLPILSLMTTIVAVLVPAGVILALASTFSGSGNARTWHTHLANAGGVALLILVYFLITFIANFFSGAIIFGANQRFRGGDPTVRSSLAGARRKFAPLALFSLMIATVGLVLQALEDRLPFAGKLATWLVNAAWSVANVFALPVIILGDVGLNPLGATRESVSIIKKVWGESVVVNLGIGLIGSLSLIVFGFGGGFLLSLLYSAAHASTVLEVLLGAVWVLGLVTILLLISVLGSIAKAALYCYATTGKAPAEFDKSLLQASMTQKKARKVFA